MEACFYRGLKLRMVFTFLKDLKRKKKQQESFWYGNRSAKQPRPGPLQKRFPALLCLLQPHSLTHTLGAVYSRSGAGPGRLPGSTPLSRSLAVLAARSPWPGWFAVKAQCPHPPVPQAVTDRQLCPVSHTCLEGTGLGLAW